MDKNREQLMQKIRDYKNGLIKYSDVWDAVDAYSSASNGVKPAVSGWVAFDDAKPKAMQEIWVVWPSGAFNPEFRQLTEDDLKQDWSDMKWCPVPPFR